MARRGLNIYKRKDGRWEGRYKNGFTSKGKPKYSSVYGKSYSAVRNILNEKYSEGNCNIHCNCTISELIKIWMSDLKNRVKESTYSNYMMKLKKHILPYFSGIKYDKLSANNINHFISQKLNSGLSEKYVSDIVILLKSMAKFAYKRYGYTNKIDCVTLPKPQKNTKKKLLSNTEQLRLKDELIKNSNFSNIGILLSYSTGIRIGELCALRWSDIDFEKSTITVRNTVQRISNTESNGTKLIISSPKSTSSIREIPLPDFMIQLLQNNKTADEDFILSGSKKIIEPRTMQYRFKNILKKACLPNINFHSLRHMFATNCIIFGFDIKTLSEILGHSSVEITLNQYVHSSLERKKSCMKLLSKNFLSI